MSEQQAPDTLASTLIAIALAGHDYVHLTRGPVTGWTCRSYKAQPPCPNVGDPTEQWDEWRVVVEDGGATNADPVVAARRRLADVRALHAPAATGPDEADKLGGEGS